MLWWTDLESFNSKSSTSSQSILTKSEEARNRTNDSEDKKYVVPGQYNPCIIELPNRSVTKKLYYHSVRRYVLY